MEKTSNSKSIFSQTLDRAVYVTYFLGAVVPLVTLAFIVDRYVLSSIEADSNRTLSMIGLTIGVGVLSLSAFLALRRLTKNAVARMDADNARLKAILAASQDLTTSLHVQAVTETAAACARDLASCPASFVVMRADPGKPLGLVAAAGDRPQRIFQACEEALIELAESSLATGTSAISELAEIPGDEVPAPGCALALPLNAEESASGALIVFKRGSQAGFGSEEQDALTTLAALTSVAVHNADLQDAQRNFFAHVTDTLVAALDSHVEGRSGHARAVAQISNRMARELGIDDQRLQTLHFASLLHDIGMLKIDAAHQRSPGYYQKHPAIGHRMLSRIRMWEEVAPVVLYHHEWFDGSGYPEARSGSDIPIESRIIAVADCFDVLLRNDPHRMALTSNQALAEIRKGAGTQFDPDVVVALAKLADRDELPTEAGQA